MMGIYRFRETHCIPVARVTLAYKATLFYLTGKVNAAPFRGFAPGEVLFRGASCRRRSADDWKITFRFVAGPNVAKLAGSDATGGNAVPQLYSYGDFSQLGIGT